MRPDSPWKPGVPAMPGKLRDRLLTLLPLISLIAAFAIVSLQHARRARIKEELIRTEREYTRLEGRYKELKDIIERERGKGPGASKGVNGEGKAKEAK